MTNLAVSVTADVTDLNSKLALAQSNLRAFNTETRSIADQMRAAGTAGSGALAPSLQAVTAQAAAARSEVARLKTQLEGTSSAASNFRERISLAGKGLDSLRLRIADYTSLASKFGEVLVAGFAIDRIVEFINKTAEMGEQLLKTSRATGVSTETLSDWHYAAGQVGVDAASVDTAIVRLGKSIQQAIMSPTSAAAQSFQAMGIQEDWLKANSGDLTAVVNKMADAMKSHNTDGRAMALVLNVMGRSAADLIPFLAQGSDGLAQMAARNRELHDEISGPQAAAMEEYERKVKDVSTAWQGFWVEITTHAAPGLTELANELSAATSQLSNLLDVKISSDSALGRILDATKARWGGLGIVGGIASAFVGPGETEKSATAGAAVGAGLGGGVPGAGVTGTGGASKPEFPNLLDNTSYDQVRVQYEKLQSQFASSRDAMLRASVNFWAQELKNTTLDATQKLEVQSQYWSAVKALNANNANESRAIAKQDADTDLQLSKQAIDAKKAQYEADLQAKKISAQQWLEALRGFTEQEYQLDLQRLQQELSTLDGEPAAYDRVYNQIRVLKAKLVTDLAQLDKQAAQDEIREQKAAAAELAKENNERLRSYRSVVSEIGSAEDSLVRNVLTKNQTLTVTLEQLSSSLIQKEIANDLKAYTAKALYSMLGMQADEKAVQGGILFHLLGETQKTAATVTGNAARTASTTLASATAGATELATTKSTITGHAASAAAAVYDDVAQIPYVGWVLAPPAAAVAFAAVEAFGSFVPSLDVGAWQVPRDMTARIHKDEAVVPANFASGMRSAISGSGKSGSSYGDTHFHAPLVHVNSSNAGPDEIARATASALRTFHPAFAAMARH